MISFVSGLDVFIYLVVVVLMPRAANSQGLKEGVVLIAISHGLVVNRGLFGDSQCNAA